jgi:hypothetical protein
MSVVTEARRIMPMARLPIPEMATEAVPVPMAIRKVIAVEVMVMKVVMGVVMTMRHAVFRKSMCAEEPVAKARAESAVATSAMRGGIDLSQNDGQAADRSHGEKVSHGHELKSGVALFARALSVFGSVNSSALAGKRSG